MAVLIADGTPPLRGYSPDEFERQYTPSSRIPSIQPYLDEYAARGASQRAATEHQRLAYGDHPDEWLWYAPAAPEHRGTAPLQVFIHGGYWQRLSADDGTLSSVDFVSRGAAFASINYTLCPGAPLSELVRQVRSAITWLSTHAAELGHHPQRIHLSGHSAGAHLAAMAVIDAPVPIAGVTFISGVYDLTAIPHTTVNEAVGLDEAEARALSPLARIVRTSTHAIVTVAQNDTDEFRRQAWAFASAWGEVPGNVPPVAIEVAGHHHFDIVFQLGDPGTALGAAVLQQMGLAAR